MQFIKLYPDLMNGIATIFVNIKARLFDRYRLNKSET